MRLASLLVLSALALLCLPVSAQAGSYNTNSCAAGDGWWGAGLRNPLPYVGTSNWVAFNDPQLTKGLVNDSDTTTNSSTSGDLRMKYGGPDYEGPYDIDGGPRSGGGEPDKFGNPINDPNNEGFHSISYGDCGWRADGTSGFIARTGNINNSGRQIYGVGNGSWQLNQFAAPANVYLANDIPAGTSVAGINTPGVYTYSAAEGCAFYSCWANGNRQPAVYYNRQDTYWSSIFYVNGVYKQGFGGTGNTDYGGQNDRAGKIANYDTGEPASQGPDLFGPGIQGVATPTPTSFKVQIACNAPGGCINSSTQDTHSSGIGAYLRSYAVMRSNNGRLDITLKDDIQSDVGISAPPGWIRGTRTVTVYGNDNQSGTRQIGLYWDDARSSGQTYAPNGTDEGRVSCSSGRRPCALSNGFSVDTTTLSNGQHSAYGRSWDDSGNPYAETAATSVYIDNQLPNSGGSCSHSLSIPDGNIASDGRRWLRSTITVATGGCDAVSGLYQYRVQYQSLSPSQYTPGQSLNWGAWQDAPGSSCVNASQGAAGQVWSLNCSFNTASFPDGTAVRFRSTWIDLAGNLYESSPSDVRYLDNTAPVLENMKWQAFKTADSSWVNIDNGWTNAKKTRLTWNPISAGNGSPINKYFYTYESDLEQSGTGACATQQPDGWLSAVGVTSTPALEEERSEECRQGKHQVWVWVQDIAGNGAVSSPPSSYKNAVAGTSQISYDSVPTAETRDLTWAKADSLMPKDLVTDPLDWSLNNSFTLQWTNPSITNTVTQSPIDIIYYQVGGGTTINGSSVADLQSYSSCIGSGAQCTLPGVKAPSEGSHPVRVWVKDAAGNSSLEQSAASQINWRKNRCVTPQ